jgi:hypothetical protein
MRKKLYVAVGLAGLCLASTTAYSQEDLNNIWKLPDDVLGTSNQISFNQGPTEFGILWKVVHSNITQ